MNAEAAFFRPETFTLKNGMQVVLVTDTSTPVIFHAVWYKVGRGDEAPEEPSGIAHFCEHMMFKGTSNITRDELNSTLFKIGAIKNAMTSFDYTTYYELIESSSIETVMRLEADRMVNLLIKEEDVASERGVVMEERKTNIESSPEGRIMEASISAFFTNHPYRILPIGLMDDIASYSSKDVKSFYKKWYHPNNAILVVVGDISLERLKELTQKYYGVLPAGPTLVRNRLKEPQRTDVLKDVNLGANEVGLPSVKLYYDAPSVRSDPKKAYALQVGLEAVFGSSVDYFKRAMITERKALSGMSTSYDGFSYDPMWLSISLQPLPGIKWKQLSVILEEVLNKALKSISPEDVKLAKARILGRLEYDRADIFEVGMIIGNVLASGYTLEDLESYPDKVNDVKHEEVLDVMMDVLKMPKVRSFLAPLSKKGAK
ncbi:M16 family metallopeptidase [Rickettsiales endosymbiont of Peranema trichophorum]|uniref:M16 family metallopeptidase n=1 Tax=Rickettsiales endosymbiont of Peranema trichophorum TaxID=2486577 RepID=UPI0013EE9E5D|nr:pitrilysin family protein [Rickettsiales endosymbiont of Peranema trichophorum]